MDKEIYQHRDYVKHELSRLAKSSGTAEQYRDLLNYHDMQVKNFQHERAIHLAVTFFFAGIAIGSWIALYAWMFTVGGEWDIVTALLTVLALILTILEGFYVRFYYHLENRTQKLYALHTKIYEQLNTPANKSN